MEATGRQMSVEDEINGAAPDRVGRLRALVEEIAGGEGLDDDRLRELLLAVLAAYAERVEETDYGLSLEDARDQLDRTAVLLAVSRLLEGADLELFEVTMWRAWARS